MTPTSSEKQAALSRREVEAAIDRNMSPEEIKEAEKNDGLNFCEWDKLALRSFAKAFYEKHKVLASRLKTLEEENARMRENIKIIDKLHNLGDAVYDVREREGEGWEGPKVVLYAQAVEGLLAALKQEAE